MGNPSTPNPYDAPEHGASANPAAQSHGEGDATGGLIPYKNPAALTAYYLSIFGMFPCIGIVLSIPAFILGIIGLKKRAANPIIKGAAHAWIGIILGGLCTIGHLAGWGLLIVGILAER